MSGKVNRLLSGFAIGALAISLQAGCGGGGGGGGSLTDSQSNSPVVESFQPASETNATAGDEVTFAVYAKEGSTYDYTWYLDSTELNDQDNSMLLDTQALEAGYHTVSVDLFAVSGVAKTTSIHWRLKVNGISSNDPPSITSTLPSGSVTAALGDSVSFAVTAMDPDATDTLTYRWLVDEVQQAEQSVAFTLDTSDLALGSHLVDVIVSDGHNHGPNGVTLHTWTLTVQEVVVANQAPVISGTSPTSNVRIAAGSNLTLQVDASDPNGDALTYRWSLDGQAQSGSGASFDYSPVEANVGTHSVQVLVDDRRSNSNPGDPTYTWSITVESTAPQNLFSNAGADQLVIIPINHVSLLGSVSGNVPAGSITTVWSKVSGPGIVTFGNPNDLETIATFGVAGTYELSLTASTGVVEGTDVMKVHVIPTIIGEQSDSTGVAPLTVDFTARYESSGTIPTDLPSGVTLRWNFGDGAPQATGPQVTHQFTSPGSFVVALALLLTGSIGATGCWNGSVSVSGTNALPIANAGPDQAVNTDASGNATVLLDGRASSDSEGPIALYLWRTTTAVISEGSTATANVILPPGIHTITLQVFDSVGASDTDTVSITVTSPSSSTPVVSIHQPAAGSTVNGTIAVTGKALDDVGVTLVDVRVDSGTYVTVSGTAAWSYPLNTTTLVAGAHTLTARARDAAGNTGISTISFTVQAESGLPAGVTLRDIDGGANYFSNWSNSFPVDATFFPIVVWAETLAGSGDARAYKNIGVNTFAHLWDGPSAAQMNQVQAAGMYVVGMVSDNTVSSSFSTTYGRTLASHFFGDELDTLPMGGGRPSWLMAGYAEGTYGSGDRYTLPTSIWDMANLVRRREPTRPVYNQYTKPMCQSGFGNWYLTNADRLMYAAASDILSFDWYVISDPWTANGHVWDIYEATSLARSYALHCKPIWPFIELSEIFSNATRKPTLAQIGAEIWNAIVAGARGIEYFNHNFYAAGPVTHHLLIDPNYVTTSNYVHGLNDRLLGLAPVINARFADGYVSVTGTMSIMAKYYSGKFYIFAIPHQVGSQTVTFTLAGSPNTVATVLDESRTCTVSLGQFTDTFANENTVHIYRIE